MQIQLNWHGMSRPRKTIVTSIWAVGAICLIYTGYLYMDYGSRLPAAPVQESGRVFPFDYKGRTVYVTAAEQTRYATTRILFLVSIAAFALLVVAWGGPPVATPDE